MKHFLKLWDESLLRPILQIVFVIGIGAVIGYSIFTRPTLRFAFNVHYPRVVEQDLSPQFSFVATGDTSDFIEFEQQNLLKVRTQDLLFLEPSDWDSSWGFVDLSLPLAPPGAQGVEARLERPTSDPGDDVFVKTKLHNDCIRSFQIALAPGSEVISGEYRGGADWFGQHSYMFGLRLPYDSTSAVPHVGIQMLVESRDRPGTCEISRSTASSATVLNSAGDLHFSQPGMHADLTTFTFGSDRGHTNSDSQGGKYLWIPFMAGNGSDNTEIVVSARVSRVTVRRSVGDLIVGSKHFEMKAASQLHVIPTIGYVRINSEENSFEASGTSADVRVNGEQLVRSRFESLPTTLQAVAATSLIALLAFLLRDAYLTLITSLTSAIRNRHSSDSEDD